MRALTYTLILIFCISSSLWESLQGHSGGKICAHDSPSDEVSLSTADASLYSAAEGSLLMGAKGFLSAEGSLFAEGSLLAEGSLFSLAEGSLLNLAEGSSPDLLGIQKANTETIAADSAIGGLLDLDKCQQGESAHCDHCCAHLHFGSTGFLAISPTHSFNQSLTLLAPVFYSSRKQHPLLRPPIYKAA